jgi:hypothetical protein
MPDSFGSLAQRHLNKALTYSSGGKITLLEAKPQFLYIRTTDSSSLSFLQLKDYRYTSSLLPRSRLSCQTKAIKSVSKRTLKGLL